MKKKVLLILTINAILLVGCGEDTYNAFPEQASSVSKMMKNEEVVGWIDYKKDSDFDNIPDYLDKCPHTLYGVKVDKNGCMIDSDKDGIADNLDKCPNSPINAKVNAEGCPVLDKLKIVNKNKNYEIEKDYYNRLKKLATLLKKNKNLNIKMEVSVDKNERKELFLEMAKALKKTLVEKFKIDAKRISIEYRGKAFNSKNKEILIIDKTKYKQQCKSINCLVK